ncbi:MAG: diguanylate cyclase [Halofilum sp. (in: g-proteobacteria)]|nr:diguanylate cyclase [Halofilum sp. (in: g-proteobacteria)]
MSDNDDAPALTAGRVLDCMQQAVLVTDAHGRVRYANPAAERLLGERADALAGRASHELLQLTDERSGQALPDPVGEVLAGPPWTTVTAPAAAPVLAVPARGAPVPVRVSAGAMHDDGDTAAGAVVTVHDDSEERALRRVVEESGTQDPLTRLVNRAEFAQRVQRLVEGADGPHALLYLDVDRFGAINDQWGHAAGDFALREITRMFSEMIRARDTFARLGGDEFGLLLEHCGPGVAEQIAGSLHATLVQRPLTWQQAEFAPTVSIGGIVVHAGETREVETLIGAAEAACERAKQDDSRPVRFEA